MQRLLYVVLISVVSGCFFDAPPPRTPSSVPDIVPGEDIKYSEFSYQNGVDVDGPTYSHSKTAEYRGRELTQYEVQMLVDPEYPKKIENYNRLRSACARGNVFKWLAAAAIIGGALTYPSLDGRVDNPTRGIIAGGIVAGGVLLGGIAYFAGGLKCDAAIEAGEVLGASEFNSTSLFAFSGTLVDDFNRRFGSKKGQSDDEAKPDAEPSPETPAPSTDDDDDDDE